MKLFFLLNLYYISILAWLPKNIKRQIIASSVGIIGLTTNILPIEKTFAADYQQLQLAETQTIQLFQDWTPSVVYINTFIERLDAFSMNIYELPQGTGSGFVWDKDGHIVTNFHVIRNAGSAKVILTGNNGNSQSFRASVTGKTDMTVLECLMQILVAFNFVYFSINVSL